MELYNGRPEDTSGRKEKEIKVYDILDSLHIPYIRADHEAVMTMEACEEIDKALEMEICKNLFLCNRKKTSYYLLILCNETLAISFFQEYGISIGKSRRAIYYE